MLQRSTVLCVTLDWLTYDMLQEGLLFSNEASGYYVDRICVRELPVEFML